MIIKENNIEKAKKMIRKSGGKAIVQSSSDEFSRKILEYGGFKILLLPKSERRDRIKFLDSGLNHVLAKIAVKKGIEIGVELARIRNLDKKQKAIELARIRQNLRICRKAGCGIKLLEVKDEKDGAAVLLSLGGVN